MVLESSEQLPNNGIPRRCGEIVSLLRERIVKGEFQAGQAIPPRTGLAEQLNCGPSTLQQALSELAREGFVRSVPRMGTFVADAPPHVSSYALVYNTSPHFGHHWHDQYFNSALASVVGRVSQRDNRKMHIYTGIGEPKHRDTLEQLRDDARNHRLAGMVMCNPNTLKVCGKVDVPVVSFSCEDNPVDAIGVDLDQRVMHQMILRELKQLGRRRVAWIMPSDTPVSTIEHLETVTAEFGLQTQPGWITGLDRCNRQWAYNEVQSVLQNTSSSDRPDALVIGEDSLVEAVAGALIRTGLRVPDDLAVFAHANFPQIDNSMLPLRYVGWDMHRVLLTCVELIDRARAGESLPPVTSIAPVLDTELDETEVAITSQHI